MIKGREGRGEKAIPIDVAVHASKKLGHLDRQRPHRLAERVEVGDDALGVIHAAGAHALAQVPDGDARRLQLVDLRDGALRVVDERLKGARHARHLDEVAGRALRDGLQQRPDGEHAEEQDGGVGEQGAPRRRRGPVAPAHKGHDGLDELGPLLDFGADGESNVCGHVLAAASFSCIHDAKKKRLILAVLRGRFCWELWCMLEERGICRLELDSVVLPLRA